ncbi:ATP-dependent helicase [Lacrimispora indolis]|uniref:ATP-dependent helicase n=1 Tax=Lacrimispora indolis TaxID=69825 RepID=UPI00045EC211|nr:ATP-dependent helicase [Lacrimispora indolis]
MVEKMTEEQKKFLAAEGKVVVKACPGSGKTYTVAHKLLSYVDNWKDYHRGVAVLSFTNVASNEIYIKAQTIHGSLGKLGYPHFVGTVDSFIDEFIVLRYGHLHTVGKVRPRMALADNWKIPYKYWRSECHRNGCVDSVEQFYYGIDGNFYKGNKQVTCDRKNARALPCQQYKRMLSERDIVFQNETALFAYQLLKKYPEVANAITERFPIIIIDEVQDTSINQMAVFELLSDSGLESMFLVGDSDQSIYEWRNADPECFIRKLEDPNWKTIELTGNFRSSQNICNATSPFSASLRGTSNNNAIGDWKDEKEKPVLLLTKKNSEDDIIHYFLDKCRKMGIEESPENVAILTRGRIYSDTDITGLWKSKEIELFAKAAYEWKRGSRKRAYQEASKASYDLIFNEDVDEYVMKQKIWEYTNEETWKDYVIDILVDMPDIEMGIAEWVKSFSVIFCSICTKYGYEISPHKDIKNIFKIKQSDKNVPYFKQISLSKYFEKKIEDKYTRSSIHGVKGESYDAVLIYIKSRTGSTITPKLLMEGSLDQELMRLAYVAMTRPRRLLMIAMPDTKGIKNCGRFPEELWKYEFLESGS